MRRKRKHKSPKKLSKNRVKKFGETLGEKTEVEIFEEVKKAVETSWKKPLRLHEDTVEVMWAATRSDAGIVSACKGCSIPYWRFFVLKKVQTGRLKC